jgi:hypothetical protein
MRRLKPSRRIFWNIWMKKQERQIKKELLIKRPNTIIISNFKK